MRSVVRATISSIAIGTLLIAWPGTISAQQPPDGEATTLIIGGTVRRVLASGVFVLEDRQAQDGELMVLAPNAESTPVEGAAVIARGTFRRFGRAELDGIRGWRDIDQPTRDAFASRPMLRAASLTTASGRSLMPSVHPPTAGAFVQRSPVTSARQREQVQLHPAGLAELIDEVGGRPVLLPRARVLAVLNPRVLLIESASSLQATVGNLDRVLVMIQDAALRVDAAAVTGADVRVAGVARTLLGARVTGEVAWPAELTPETIKRLEIKAAVLATSVRTADGVELTVGQRPSEP